MSKPSPPPLLYSTNPWFATDLARAYRGGKHFCWCSEHFDSAAAPSATAASLVAPSSNPKRIYYQLHDDVSKEDKHSHLLKAYRKTFRRLATGWHADGELSDAHRDEIIAKLQPGSWRIWRPILYVIPRAPIEAAGRLKMVPYPKQAGYGPELQIEALMPNEFDIIELAP